MVFITPMVSLDVSCTSPVDLCMAQDATSRHGGAETQCHGAATAGVERGRNPGAASATKTVGEGC